MIMETNEKCCQGGRWHNRFWCYLGFGFLGVVGFAFFALIFGWVIMVLWNALMPQLFGLAILSFWQSVGLALLARLLFGASHMGKHHWRHKRWHHGHGCCDDNYQGHNSHGYGHKFGDCGCGSGRWQYYEKYWEEVGEKSFKEYVNLKEEESKKTQGQ
jgi:hypothetical protein